MNLFSSQLAQPPLPLPPSWFPLLPPDPLLQQQKCAQSARRIARYTQSCKGNVCCSYISLINTFCFILFTVIKCYFCRQKELERLMMIKEGKGSEEDVKDRSAEPFVSDFQKCLQDRRVSLETQESLAVEAANSLMLKLRAQLEPFRYIADETSPWEEKSAPARLENKLIIFF